MRILYSIFVLNLLFSQKVLLLSNMDKLTPDDMIITLKETLVDLGTKKDDVSNQIYCLNDFKMITKSFNNIIENSISSLEGKASQISIAKATKQLLTFIVNLYQKNKGCFKVHPENVLNKLSDKPEEFLKDENLNTFELSKKFSNYEKIMKEIQHQLIHHQYNLLGKNIAKLIMEPILSYEENPRENLISILSIYQFVIDFYARLFGF